MILSKVTKNQGFKLSLKNAISEKPKGCIGFGGGDQIDPSLFRF